MLDTLLVPNTVAGDSAGSAINKAGTWIKPPPPATASTNPANKAASILHQLFYRLRIPAAVPAGCLPRIAQMRCTTAVRGKETRPCSNATIWSPSAS